MRLLPKQILANPLLVRVVPFVLFVFLTALQGSFGEASKYWFYLGKTILGIWLICGMRGAVSEMRWKMSWEACAVGLAVWLMWIGIDAYYPHLGKPGIPWNPNGQFGMNSFMSWLFILTRILGSTFVVPPLEEVFYRSFLYRYAISREFLSVAFNRFDLQAFIISAVVFGICHSQWLAGILCAFAYQALVLRKNRLGDAMTAHAITNLLLGITVVAKGWWQFW